MSIERSYDQARVAFQRLQPEPGDIITVTLPTDIIHEQMVALAEVLQPLSNEHDCSIIFLRSGVTVEILTEQHMNNLGWFRLDPKQKH